MTTWSVGCARCGREAPELGRIPGNEDGPFIAVFASSLRNGACRACGHFIDPTAPGAPWTRVPTMHAPHDPDAIPMSPMTTSATRVPWRHEEADVIPPLDASGRVRRKHHLGGLARRVDEGEEGEI